MTEGPKQLPHRTAETERVAEEREVRLAAALRENLRRRKAQTRERDDAPPGTVPDAPPEPPKS
jgi:hypothetical protein